MMLRLIRPPVAPGPRRPPPALVARLGAATVMGIALLTVWQAPPSWLMAPAADVAKLGVVVPTPGHTVIVAPPADGASSSELTAHGLGTFADLAVTVSQTTDLVNQAITVSWTGATPTPDAPLYPRDFLQIMQCWGDDLSTGPDRTQCAFGARAGAYTNGVIGDQVALRQLSTAANDPDEPDDASGGALRYEPFISAAGLETDGVQAGTANPDFNSFTSNEVPVARTFPDGTGSTVFETQTDVQAPGLGCGRIIVAGEGEPAPADQVGKPRRCWLVVVPRGDSEVDGSTAPALSTPTHKLESSPLSATNWANRIAFPLAFRAVGPPCPLGTAETPTAGSSLAAEAVYSWQPKLCQNSGPVFGFTPLSESVVRGFVTGDDPGLSFVNRPIPSLEAPEGVRLVNAPLLLSGLTIAVSFDRQPLQDAPADVVAQTSRPITDVRLTPRVVAKLLTASYQTGAADGAPEVRGVVASVLGDPDFLYDNPDFAQQSGTLDIVVPFGNDDIYALLWKWVMSDRDAADFIAGLPDNLSDTDKNVRKTVGMRVNPFYQGLELPQTSFPQLDPHCVITGDVARYNDTHSEKVGALCQGDFHQYSGGLSDNAVAALRGDRYARTNFDLGTGLYGKVAPAGIGRRSVMGLTETASARRYSVATARLRNASGAFVAPDAAGLTAGLAAMHDVGGGLLEPDVTSTNPAAYPLTLLTYAVTRPGVLSTADAAAYAAFLRYAVGDGQTPGTLPGQLPAGYAPLPANLRTQALKAADDVAARVGRAMPTPTPTTRSATTSVRRTSATTRVTSARSTTSAARVTSAATTPVTGGTTPPPTGIPTDLPTATTTTELARATTPSDSPGAARYAVMAALMLGISGTLAGPSLPGLARRLR